MQFASQDLAGGGSTTLADAIASQKASTSHGTAHAHGTDAAKQAEHTQLLDLMPKAGAANVAVALNGGSWFDPQTWSTGKIPGDGASAYIPAGISVVYDEVSDARLDRIGVDGELHFAVDTDTRMVTDTLLTGPSSVLTIGTKDNPVQKGVSAEIVIHRDNGPIDVKDDPGQLTKGVVTHGAVSIAGQDKADHVRAVVDPSAGDTTLILDGAKGWEVGDKIVVAGTKLVGENKFEDETVTVTGIQSRGDGTYAVSIDTPLAHDHDTPADFNGVKFEVPVANYTRNVSIGTETDAAAYTDDGKTVPIDERGHVMFMHNGDVTVRNAEFYELGRTDKSEVLDTEGGTNVGGRYALHFHRTGGDPDEQPSLAEGNAVWGSPGWGIVHHDAHLDVVSNAVFGVNGGAIIAEAGNETGKWSGNITMQTTGTYSTFNPVASGNPDHIGARQEQLNDSFTQGTGYGFKSRTIDSFDNLAVSSNAAGYEFWPMGNDDGVSDIDPTTAAFEYLNGYEQWMGADDAELAEVPLRQFDNNEVMVAHVGFATTADKRGTDKDVPSVVDGFVAWEVNAGVVGFYQENYLIKDSTFVGRQGEMTGGHNGLNKVGTDSTGIVTHSLNNLKLVENQFRDFDKGIFSDTFGNDTRPLADVILGNTYENVTDTYDLQGLASQFRHRDDSGDWRKSVDVGRLDARVDVGASDLVVEKPFDRIKIVVEKTDAIGAETIEIDGRNFWSENAANEGYYVDGGKYYVLVDVLAADRVTGSVVKADVAIELAFVKAAGDLPAGAKDMGPLPASLGADGTGDFVLVDKREIGKSGNQLDPQDRTFDPGPDQGDHADHGDHGDHGDQGGMPDMGGADDPQDAPGDAGTDDQAAGDDGADAGDGHGGMGDHGDAGSPDSDGHDAGDGGSNDHDMGGDDTGGQVDDPVASDDGTDGGTDGGAEAPTDGPTDGDAPTDGGDADPGTGDDADPGDAPDGNDDGTVAPPPQQAPQPLPPVEALDVVGQSGVIELARGGGTDWVRVTFDQSLDDAVVVVGPASSNDDAPVVTEVRNVTDDGFEVRLREWDYQDGVHAAETLSWVAVKAGRHELAAGQIIEAGVDRVSDRDGDVSFTGAFDDRPVVFAQAMGAAGDAAVTDRIRSVDADGFDVSLQKEEAHGRTSATGDVGWIAIAEGRDDGMAAGHTGRKVGDKGHTIEIDGADASEFVFLADLQSRYGADTAALRFGDVSADGVTVFAQEEQSKNREMRHIEEDVGYLALEAGLIVAEDQLA